MISEPGPVAAHARQLIEDQAGSDPFALHGIRFAEVVNDKEIVATAKVLPAAGLGVVGGYNDHVPIDVDTDDPKIRAVIRKTLPAVIVAKKGARGASAFFRGRIRARKLIAADGQTLVEVLTSGQTVVPPSIHPKTDQPMEHPGYAARHEGGRCWKSLRKIWTGWRRR